MHILFCRYNLIEGELRIDTANKQLIFVRHSLGEKEVYATWNFSELKKFEVELGLLTEEVVVVLQSNEVLRFATNEIQPKIKDWIETRKSSPSLEMSDSKATTANVENKSQRKNKTASQNRSKKKNKSKNKIEPKELEKKKSKNSFKQNPQSSDLSSPFEDIRKNLKEETDSSTSDTSFSGIKQREAHTEFDYDNDLKDVDPTTEAFNDIANVFHEMKADLKSNQSSFERNKNANVKHRVKNSPSSIEDIDDSEQKGCCSNWIIWLIAFIFLAQCLGS